MVTTFGPTNIPTTFIQMIHNLDSAWKDLVARSGIIADDNTNTNIIVDDIFDWAISFDSTLQYLECQLQNLQSLLSHPQFKEKPFLPHTFRICRS